MKHVYYHVKRIASLCSNRIQDAWGWCTGKIQRDDMGWEVGGGFRIGNLYMDVHPWLIQVNVWQNQYSIIKQNKVKIKKNFKERYLLLGRKDVTNLDDIFKIRDITLPTKVHLVTAMVFPVVMYRCETWTIKKAECQRIDAFELWCWRRLLRVLGLQRDPTSSF